MQNDTADKSILERGYVFKCFVAEFPASWTAGPLGPNQTLCQ